MILNSENVPTLVCKWEENTTDKFWRLTNINFGSRRTFKIVVKGTCLYAFALFYIKVLHEVIHSGHYIIQAVVFFHELHRRSICCLIILCESEICTVSTVMLILDGD